MNESRGNLGQQTGFTIIEILATIGLMVAVLFLAVPSLQKSQRDSARREVARKTYTALIEFYNRNQRFPACDSGAGDPCDSGDMDDASRFIMSYLPQDRDPTTGEAFSSSSLISGPGLIFTSSNSTLYAYDSTQVNHSYKPPWDKYISVVGIGVTPPGRMMARKQIPLPVTLFPVVTVC